MRAEKEALAAMNDEMAASSASTLGEKILLAQKAKDGNGEEAPAEEPEAEEAPAEEEAEEPKDEA